MMCLSSQPNQVGENPALESKDESERCPEKSEGDKHDRDQCRGCPQRCHRKRGTSEKELRRRSATDVTDEEASGRGGRLFGLAHVVSPPPHRQDRKPANDHGPAQRRGGGEKLYGDDPGKKPSHGLDNQDPAHSSKVPGPREDTLAEEQQRIADHQKDDLGDILKIPFEQVVKCQKDKNPTYQRADGGHDECRPQIVGDGTTSRGDFPGDVLLNRDKEHSRQDEEGGPKDADRCKGIRSERSTAVDLEQVGADSPDQSAGDHESGTTSPEPSPVGCDGG